jgi:hypothetical protein
MRRTSLAALVAVLIVGCSAHDRRGAQDRAAGAKTSALTTLQTFPAVARRLANARPVAPSGDLRVRFPQRATEATHLETSSLVWLDITAEGLRDVAAVPDGATLVYPNVLPDTDLVESFDGSSAEELRLLRTLSAKTVFTWRVRLGPAIAKVSMTSGFVQAFDGEGRARLRAEPLVAWDAKGRERALDVEVLPISANEVRLVARLDTRDLEFPIAVDPAWGATNNMAQGRYETYLVRLPTAKVFVAGGRGSTGYLATAEIFDPATMTWTLQSPMKTARADHSTVVMSDGRVMAVAGSGITSLSSCEIWDPATNTWSDAASLPVTTWANGIVAVGGKVVLAGGAGNTANTYTFNEPAGPWTANVSKLSVGRYGLAGVAYSATKAIFIGGTTTDLYDSTTNTFSPGPALGGNRLYPAAVVLSSGRILIAGGNRLDADLFEPPGSMSTIAGLTFAHEQGGEFMPALAAVAGDKAVLTGGYNTTINNVATDVFNGATKSWTRGPDVTRPRHRALAMGLADGRGLVAAGSPNDTSGVIYSSTEIYADTVATGSSCTTSAQCASGFCADGVCCNSACNQACESCNETGSIGTCKLVIGAPRAGHGTCIGGGTCGGTCDGTSTTCAYPSSSVTCVAGSCAGGTEQPPAYCSSGVCPTAPATKSCGLFTCGTVTCKTTCAADTDCVASAHCNTTTSICELKKPNGGTCTGATGCASGICALEGTTGTCCDKACTGGCETCSASGALGLCQLRANGTTCGVDACTGSTLTVAAKCDGVSATCPAAAPTPCPSGFACASDGKTCKTTCATGTDCATGYCDLASAKCSAPPGDGGVTDTGTTPAIAETGAPTLPATPSVTDAFLRCTKASDCTTGFCVDGVCCDSACTDKCSSCALLSNPGKCTVEPVGVDLRNECGPANQCLGTCDGAGQCIGAGKGTMCGRNRCTSSSSGVGPAYCAAPGAKCALDDAVPFECSPYACEPAFGACRSTCAASTDCANGFICDTTAKNCVPTPAPPADEGGCAFGGPSQNKSGIAAMILAALALAGRARRSRRMT